MASITSTSNGSTPRRHRYTRASTTSVTQLLSDGYSSIMNRFTKRGPSEKPDPTTDSKLTTARTRYDDKLLANKNSALASIRRYENNRHISPYMPLTSGAMTQTNRKLNQDSSSYLNYLGSTRSRLENSPLHSANALGALRRSDSFRSAHMKDKRSSPMTKRYPLKETNNNIDSALLLGSTRSRLEDKYSSVLDRIAHQKKEKARKEKEDRDKTLEPETSVSRGGLMRSLTTAVFGEKSFNRTHYSREKTRDKTPYKSGSVRRHLSTHKIYPLDEFKNGFDVSPKEHSKEHYGKDRNSVYRRHQRRSLRAEKSETNDRKAGKLSLRPVDIGLQSGTRDLISPAARIECSSKLKLAKTPITSPTREVGRQRQIYFPSSDEDDDKTPVNDPVLSERETRRKEIQSLIMKYAHLDEAYGRMGVKDTKNGSASECSLPNKAEPLGVGDVVALPPELRSRHRPQRPRHQTRRAATPPVSRTSLNCVSRC